MAATLVEIPDIQFSGFYYHEILETQLAYKRINLPELSDENEHEPTIQLLRAFSLMGHYNNTIVDVVAQETIMTTARLAETVREHLRLIDYNMAPARPATVEVVLQLSKTFASSTTLAPAGAQFATVRDPDTLETVFFETDEQVETTATDTFTDVFVWDETSDSYVDFTAEANSATTPADDWTPWSGASAGDILYIMHDSVMWNRLDVTITTDVVPGSGFGIWEYYQGDTERAKPDSVTQVGTRLRFVVNNYLGEDSRRGTFVRVQINSTTLSEELEVIWDGTQNIIETSDLLGQSIVSLDVEDYSIGSEWEEFSVTGTSGFTDLYFGENDTISWDIQQSTSQNWVKTTVDSKTGFFVRFRWIESPVSSPVVQKISLTEGKQFAIVPCTQGKTITDSPLGSSTGEPNQVFVASKDHFIDDTNVVIEVDSVEWTQVDNFIRSSPTDQHYIVRLSGSDDTANFVFGDGQRGSIPSVGVSNVSGTYRYGSEIDGNVGSNTVISDKTSLSFVSSIYNPRQAVGWSASEGATDEGIALAKEVGPALLRVVSSAVSAPDVANMTLRFVDDNGVSPYSRAFPIEESYGPKTIELVVTPKGGGLATSQQLLDLAEFFNGDKYATPPVEARLVSNQKVTATNYTQKLISVTATVYGTNVTVPEIQSALEAVINPEALKEDGVTWEWEFGTEVSISRIKHEIHKVSSSITKVEISTPSSNTQLTFRELPIAGAINITLVEPS